MTGSIHIKRLSWATALLAAFVAFVVPGATAAGSPEQSSRTLRNDVAHFETDSSASSTPAPVVISKEEGFDWASAGVGAAAALGLMLVLGVGRVAPRGSARSRPEGNRQGGV